MASYNQLSYGSRGSDVTELQKLLNQHGYNLEEDGIFGDLTRDAVNDYQQKNGLTVDGIVGDITWGSLTGSSSSSSSSSSGSEGETETEEPSWEYTPYEPGDSVTDAENLLNQWLNNKPGDYQSQWQDLLDELLNKYNNRDDFTYDLNGDALYQQYKDQYTTQGKLGMMDTMGQAQAMTGGYGNSYAQTVGQQTYQGYLQGLNDKVPELYQLALNQYNQEGQDLLNQYALYAEKEGQDYGRWRDSMSDYLTELDRLTNQYRYEAEQDYNRWWNDQGFHYQQERDETGDEQWQQQFDEAQRQFNQQMAKAASTGSSGGGGGGGGPKDPVVIDDTPSYADVMSKCRSMVASGKTAEEIRTFIMQEVQNGNIDQYQAQRLLSTYVPRGYQP